MKNDWKLYIKKKKRKEKVEAGCVARETCHGCCHVGLGGIRKGVGRPVGWACGVEGKEGSVGILNFLCH